MNKHYPLKATLTGILLSILPHTASGAIPQLQGIVASSSDHTPTGFYSLPTEADGTWDLHFKVETTTTAVYSGIVKDDTYFVSRVNAQYGGALVYLDAFDLTTNQKRYTEYIYGSENVPYDMTLNPADGKIYGIFLNKAGTGVRFCKVNYSQNNNVITEIKALEGNWNGIASDAAGNIYAIRMDMAPESTTAMPVVAGSTLCKLDCNTGDITEIGATGQKPLLSGSVTIETKSGRMFWTVAPDGNNSYLCEVDVTTGQATKLFDFDGNRQIVGLYAPTPLADDKAPAAVTDASLSFNGAEMEGSLSFKAPTTLFDGTEASGALTYTITLNGETVTTGDTSYGSVVNVAVTAPQRGACIYKVTVKNESGPSPTVEINGFAGYGTPETPDNINPQKTDNKITITWDPVTTTTDGGFIDPTQIKYNVTALPAQTVIASGISTTSAEMAIDPSTPLTAFSFRIVAVNGGFESEPAESAKVVVGSPVLPWTETFDNPSSLDFFTIIDANDDERTWSYNTDGSVRVQWNSSLEMDDWLITPALDLRAGNSYKITVKAKSANQRYPERIEIKWGDTPAPEAMTNTLVEGKELGEQYEELTGYINPSESGLYYIGMHGISDKDCMYLHVDEISVESGLSTATPAGVTDIAAVADPSGDYKATLTFKAPTLTMDNSPLSSITKIEVKQEDTVLHTFTNPAPGEELTCELTLPTGGEVSVQIVVSNVAGSGAPTEFTFFIGVPKAQPVAEVVISETAPGTVRLSWETPVKSFDGGEINSARIRYNVYDLSGEQVQLIESNIGSTDLTINMAGVEDTQKFVQYGVSAVTEGGETDKTASEIIPVGKPYTDYTESFANGSASTLIRFQRINYGNWALMTDNSEVSSQDNDNGYAVMNAYFTDYCGALYTGKISLEAMENPVLKFYSYTPDNEAADLNPITISVNDGSGFKQIYSHTVIEIGATQGWHLAEVPLAAYAGKTIQVSILATTRQRPYTSTYIDNLSIQNETGIDLEVLSLSAPKHVRCGEEFTLTAKVRNNSAFEVSDHNMELYLNDELCLSKDGDVIPPMATATVTFKHTMSPLIEGKALYTAKVCHDNDPLQDNNVSGEICVNPVSSPLPAPSSLKAVKNNNDDNILLSWKAPELSTIAPSAVTDDFEGSEAWAHEAGNWLFEDRDNAAVIGFGEAEIPNINPGITHASFFVFSATGLFEGNEPLAPHSGSQYLAALARFDSGLTDDWLISPELSGDAQTVSFWAQSYDRTNTWPEAIEVLYSQGSVYPEDFKASGFSKNPLPNGWTKYDVTLPAGARRFAVRSSSRDSFMLMLDDVTYTPASTHNAEITGYNIYRDGEKINDTPITSPGYTDAVDNPDSHSWVVTAVYNHGESRGSNEATAEQGSGLSEMSEANISIATAPGQILISGAEGIKVMVASVDGKIIYTGKAADSMCIDVVNGIYIVSAGNVTAKVNVK